MSTLEPDDRSAARRGRDEQIAAQPPLDPPALPPHAQPLRMEAHLAGRRHPVAVAGVVENGLVRPLDPAIRLAEHARVIIVASEDRASL